MQKKIVEDADLQRFNFLKWFLKMNALSETK
jgi:hypothetical protein